MLQGCKKCCGITAIIFLVLGIIFLLGDFNVWGFWGIQWWSALFVVIGVTGLAMGKCPDCNGSKGK